MSDNSTEWSIRNDLYNGNITQLDAVKQLREYRNCSFKESFDEVLLWVEVKYANNQ